MVVSPWQNHTAAVGSAAPRALPRPAVGSSAKKLPPPPLAPAILAASHRRRGTPPRESLRTTSCTSLLDQRVEDTPPAAAPHAQPVSTNFDIHSVEPPLGMTAADDIEMQPVLRRSSTAFKAEAVLARDSDAVPSVFYPELKKIGALLSTPDGGSSLLCYAIQATGVMFGVLSLFTNTQNLADQAGIEPNMLMWVNTVLWSSSWLLGVLACSSTRKALCSGGALEQLKAGDTMISKHDSTTLWRWRVGISVASVFVTVVGTYFLVVGIVDMFTSSKPVVTRFTDVLFGLVWSLVGPVGLVGWWTSMYVASALCKDDIIEVIKNVRSVPPTSDAWDAKVAQPALALIDKMQLLSDGWSGGLTAVGGFCLLNTLANFCHIINKPLMQGWDIHYGNPPGTRLRAFVLYIVTLTSIPFLLAMNIANTSSWCDNLMEEFNVARSNHGPENHLKIHWLETTLRQLNGGQGLGFKVPGLGVIDKTTLTALATKLYVVLGTLITTLLAMAEEQILSGDVCALSAVQSNTIQEVMVGSNATCFNRTLNSIMNSA